MTRPGPCAPKARRQRLAKRPVLDPADWRKLIDSIRTGTVRDLRDRALIATLTYSFARNHGCSKHASRSLPAAGRRWRLRMHGKGGQTHVMPCHHALAEALHAYIAAAGIAEHRKGCCSAAAAAKVARCCPETDGQPEAWRMIRKRAAAAGIAEAIAATHFGRRGLRRISGERRRAGARAEMARMKPRTTKLYDRTKSGLPR